jgi:uncharacterized protein (DUF1501 family)
MTMIARRRFLMTAAGAAGVLLAAPRQLALAATGAATAKRFVFVIQRGAADGLDIVAPVGDPDYQGLRGAAAIDAATAARLDGSFALHPALPSLAGMYAKGEALFVHAVASPYRDRSHFDAQNVLESGGSGPFEVRDGWMNRLAGLLPHDGDAPIAFASTVPMALRGSEHVASYAPDAIPDAPDDLLARVTQLYAKDPELHSLWDAALEARMVAGDAGKSRLDAAALGALAARFLVQPLGPRIAMIETGGWDTHSQQATRLPRSLKSLDAMLAALQAGLGAEWANTTVLIATEFGRTAAINGTGGTDHGTASVAMLVGGSVIGGRVLADWPGLKSAALYQGRDLSPTMALDALIAGSAGEALGLDPEQVSRTLFRGQAATKPLSGFVRS